MKKHKKIVSFVLLILILSTSIIAYASYSLGTSSDSYWGYTLEGYASYNLGVSTFYFSGWSDTYYTLGGNPYIVDWDKLDLDCYKNGSYVQGYMTSGNGWLYYSSGNFSYSYSDDIDVWGAHESRKGTRSLYVMTYAD